MGTREALVVDALSNESNVSRHQENTFLLQANIFTISALLACTSAQRFETSFSIIGLAIFLAKLANGARIV